MKKIETSAYELAQRFVGEIRERPGEKDHPFIVWCHSLCGLDAADEVPWCSSFANGIAWILRLPRSKSASARSWLAVGVPVNHSEAVPGFDVVILKRGEGEQPGPEVLNAAGHVGFFGGFESGRVLVLGGNQGDQVSVAPFPMSSILGIRRLAA